MSLIIADSNSEIQSTARIEACEQAPPDLAVLANEDIPTWFEDRKEVNYVPIPSVNTYDGAGGARVFTNAQRFINNNRKTYVLQHSIHYISPLTYWFKRETLLNMGAMQLIKIISGITDLDHLNYLLTNNQGIYKYMKDPTDIGYLVYRYSLMKKTKIPEELERSIFMSLVENLMFYIHEKLNAATDPPKITFYPEVTWKMMEKMGFYNQLTQDNEVNQPANHIKVGRKYRQELNPISAHFLCAHCMTPQNSVSQNYMHVNEDHKREKYHCHSRAVCGTKNYKDYTHYMLHKMTFCRDIADSSDKACVYCNQTLAECICNKSFEKLLVNLEKAMREPAFVEFYNTNLLPAVTQYCWDQHNYTTPLPEGDLIPDNLENQDPVIILQQVSMRTVSTEYQREIYWGENVVIKISDLTNIIRDRMQKTENYLYQIEEYGIVLSQNKSCVFHEDCSYATTVKTNEHYRNAHYICPYSLIANTQEPPILRNDYEFVEHLYRYHLAHRIEPNNILVCIPDKEYPNEFCQQGFYADKYESASVMYNCLLHHQKEHSEEESRECRECNSWTFKSQMMHKIHLLSWHPMSADDMWELANIKHISADHFRDVDPRLIGHQVNPQSLNYDPNIDKQYLGVNDEPPERVEPREEEDDDDNVSLQSNQDVVNLDSTVRSRRSSIRRNSVNNLPVARQLFTPGNNINQVEDEDDGIEGVQIPGRLHACNASVFLTEIRRQRPERRVHIRTPTTTVGSLANARPTNNNNSNRGNQNVVAIPAAQGGTYKCHNESHQPAKEFLSEESKALHIIAEHRCPQYNSCKFSAEMDSEIMRHYRTVHLLQQTTCQICNEQVPTEDLQSHINNTHYKCSSCLRFFNTEVERDEHLNRCKNFNVPIHNQFTPMLIGGEHYGFRADQELEVASKEWSSFEKHMIDRSTLNADEKLLGKQLLERRDAVEQIKRVQARTAILTNTHTIKQLMFVLPRFHTGETKDVSKSAGVLLAGITPDSKLTSNCQVTPSKALQNFHKIDGFTRKIREYSNNMPLSESQCKLVLSHFLAQSIKDTIEGLSQVDFCDLSYLNIITYLQKLYCPLSLEQIENDVLQAKISASENLLTFQKRVRKILELCSNKLPEADRYNYVMFHLRRLTIDNLPDKLKQEIKKNELTSAQYTVNELSDAFIAFSQKESENIKVGWKQEEVGKVERNAWNKNPRKDKDSKTKSIGDFDQLMHPGKKKESVKTERKGKIDREKGRERSRERSQSASGRQPRRRSPSSEKGKFRSKSRSRSRGRFGRFRNRKRSKSYEAREVRNNPQNDPKNNNSGNGNNYNNQGNQSRMPYFERNRLRKEEFETKKKRIGEPWASLPKFCLRCSDKNHWADSPQCIYDHTLPISDNICWGNLDNKKIFCGYHVQCKNEAKWKKEPKNVYWMRPKVNSQNKVPNQRK